MVIVTGRIKVMSNSVDGKEIVLNFLGPGDTTGEIAVLDGKQRTADVIALEKSEVFLVHSRDLLPLLIAHPQALLEVVQVLCEKLRAASANPPRPTPRLGHLGHRPSSPRGRMRIVRAAAPRRMIVVMYCPM